MKILMVELTNHCNEDCWFCPHSKMVREKGFMSMDTVELAVEKMKLVDNGRVVLTGTGESLLHPRLFEIVEMFKEFYTSITVRASALNEELVEGLINSSLDLVRVSVDFDCDEALVRKLIKKNKGTTTVNFKSYDRKINVVLREKWPDAEIMNIGNWAGQMDFNSHVQSNICPFEDMNACVLLWDGRLSGCCFDYDGKHIIGTLEHLEKMKFKQGNLCKECGGLY